MTITSVASPLADSTVSQVGEVENQQPSIGNPGVVNTELVDDEEVDVPAVPKVDDDDDDDDAADAGGGKEDDVGKEDDDPAEDVGDGGFDDGLDDDDELDEFDDIDEDDFDDDFDDDFEEELGDDYEIEIDDEISAEFGLNTAGGLNKEDDVVLEDFDDFENLHRD